MADLTRLPALFRPEGKFGPPKEVCYDEYAPNAKGQLGATTNAIDQDQGPNQHGDALSSDLGKTALNKTKKKRRARKKKSKANVQKDGSDEVEKEADAGLRISYPLTTNKPQLNPLPLPPPPAVTENRVDRAIREWKALNEAPFSDANELFDLCLSQESIVYNALVQFRPLEIDSFKRKLQDFGYEVKDAVTHHSQALEFGSRIPEQLRDFPITIAEQNLGTRQLSFIPGADGLWEQFDGDRDIFPPRLELWVRSIHRDLVAAYRAEKIGGYQGGDQEDNQSSEGFSSSVGIGTETSEEGGGTIVLPPDTTGLISDADRFITASEFGSEPYSSSPEDYEDGNGLEIKIHRSVSFSHSENSTSNNTPELTATLQLFRMSNITQVSLPLPVLPQSWSAEGNVKITGTLSPAIERSIEPVGPHFLAHARRARHKRTFSEDDRIQAQENVKKIEDDDDGEISEPEDPMMLSRDAKDWKNQDHYAVLGLSKYRYKATEEQIKRAHRKKVLRHHPDKKAAAGSAEDDSFFKCIQKATEILLDPVKRRQYDSVDEHADVEPPTKKLVQKGNFYKLWGPVFRAEGRFSRIQPVSKLGDENSTREEVENFYNFWYNFDSWRSFEYQDEDVPDDNENRDQKRHMERKNNNARKKKKTEDSARLRKLLDECSSMDDRIKKFRQEANASKNKKRMEKEAAEKKAAEEAKVKKEAEERAAKEAEEAAKAEREQGKKAKEAAKNAIKKNKRVLKSSVKDANYFVQGDPPAAQIDAVLNDVELIQGKVDTDDIAALASNLNGLKLAHEIKGVWSAEVKKFIEGGKLKDGEVKTLA